MHRVGAYAVIAAPQAKITARAGLIIHRALRAILTQRSEYLPEISAHLREPNT